MLHPAWGYSNEPIHNGKWVAGWRHAPSREDDVENLFTTRLEAWVWLRVQLLWMLDDHYEEDLFTAAARHANLGGDHYGKCTYVVQDTTYYMEPSK